MEPGLKRTTYCLQYLRKMEPCHRFRETNYGSFILVTYEKQSVGYIPNSIKVALGIGKLLFGGHSSKALHCGPYAQMQNDQLPKQPLLN